MASVMGVTWILGIVANLKALSFLWYPFVVLNSLQGMFPFITSAQRNYNFVFVSRSAQWMDYLNYKLNYLAFLKVLRQ